MFGLEVEGILAMISLQRNGCIYTGNEDIVKYRLIANYPKQNTLEYPFRIACGGGYYI